MQMAPSTFHTSGRILGLWHLLSESGFLDVMGQISTYREHRLSGGETVEWYYPDIEAAITSCNFGIILSPPSPNRSLHVRINENLATRCAGSPTCRIHFDFRKKLFFPVAGSG